MKHDVGLEFHVQLPTGRVETLLVDAPSALIGTAAHCEVRLPAGEAAQEHVEVVAMGDGTVHVSAREAPPQIDGVPIVSGPWPAGRTLVVGRPAIMVKLVDLTPQRRQRSPFWALAPVPVLAAVAIIVATRSAPAADAIVPPAPPLLAPVITTCPNATSATLPAFAAERARIGLAKRERSPFSPADGIEATAVLETAAACYRAANMTPEEKEIAAIAANLRAKLDEEYHVRRVRVEHAFKVGDPFGAKRELAVLLPMTAHRRGPYIDWLASVDRYATAAIDQRSTRRL